MESQLHRTGTPLPVVRAPRGAAFGGFVAGESAPKTGWNDEAQPVLNGLSVDVEEWWHEPGHPLDDYAGALKRKDVLTLSELTKRAERGALVARIAGAVSSRQERKSARGNRFAFVQLSDPTGLYEVTVFSETLEAAREHLESGSNVVLTVEATMESNTLKLLARAAQPIDDEVADAWASGLLLRLEGPHPLAELGVALSEGAEGARVSRKSLGDLRFAVTDPATGGAIEIDAKRQVPVTPAFKALLRSVGGVLSVEEV